jgi:hypothetical protein
VILADIDNHMGPVFEQVCRDWAGRYSTDPLWPKRTTSAPTGRAPTTWRSTSSRAGAKAYSLSVRASGPHAPTYMTSIA